MNTSDRQQAIKAILSGWIEMDDPTCIGQLIHTRPSFSQLRNEVVNLKGYGRSMKWTKAINEWLAFIDLMHKIFCDENGFSYISAQHWHTIDTDYAFETRREFQRIIKHAVMQGSTYAFIGA